MLGWKYFDDTLTDGLLYKKNPASFCDKPAI